MIGSHDGKSLNSHLVEVAMIMLTRIINEIKLSILKSNVDVNVFLGNGSVGNGGSYFAP